MNNNRKKPTREQREESDGWNSWQPGSGRRGQSPFNKPIPPVRDAETGHPIKDGKIDWARVIQDANERNSNA